MLERLVASAATLKVRLIIAAVLAVLIVAAVLWYGEWRADKREAEVSQRYELAINKQKAEAAALLAKETARVLALERQLNAARAAQEKTDAANAKTVADLRADLRARSRAAGGPGLRDPFAGRGIGSGGAQGAAAPGAGGGAANPAQAPGLLSAELEGFLLARFAEADALNIAYASCRADSEAVRAVPP